MHIARFAVAVAVASTVGAALLAHPAEARAEPPFSATAAGLSDTTLAVSVVTPIALQVGAGFDEGSETGEHLLVYGEAMGASLVLNGVTKLIVRRPRPYTTSRHPRIVRYADSQRLDARLSFYSGHSSTAFTAAVAGSLLYQSEDPEARAGVWGVSIALASATANLRVRAGKHYYSDVIAGSLLGTAIGLLVVVVQEDVPTPTAGEWATIGGGLVVGVLVSQLIPVKRDIIEPLEVVTPVAYPGGGGGLMFGGSF
jgi:membrane-associated phospholipid phosphatase